MEALVVEVALGAALLVGAPRDGLLEGLRCFMNALSEPSVQRARDRRAGSPSSSSRATGLRSLRWSGSFRQFEGRTK